MLSGWARGPEEIWGENNKGGKRCEVDGPMRFWEDEKKGPAVENRMVLSRGEATIGGGFQALTIGSDLSSCAEQGPLKRGTASEWGAFAESQVRLQSQRMSYYRSKERFASSLGEVAGTGFSRSFFDRSGGPAGGHAASPLEKGDPFSFAGGGERENAGAISQSRWEKNSSMFVSEDNKFDLSPF